MYDLPAVVEATDAWWKGVAHHIRDAGISCVPDQLTRSSNPMSDWVAPDLLISQTCGYPLTHKLAGQVQIVATPRYNAPGCQGARYASILIVREQCEAESIADLAGQTAVINGLDSQSGCHVLRYMLATETDGHIPFFSEVRVSGGHVASIETVTAGHADVAAIDAVTHALLARHTPGALNGTRVLGVSPRMPGLPYITRSCASENTVERLRAGLVAAANDPELVWARRELLIDGFDVLSPRHYAAITDMENRINQIGLPSWEPNKT